LVARGCASCEYTHAQRRRDPPQHAVCPLPCEGGGV
jgi:hypothetical protein